jgi:hypothetical protein
MKSLSYQHVHASVGFLVSSTGKFMESILQYMIHTNVTDCMMISSLSFSSI